MCSLFVGYSTTGLSTYWLQKSWAVCERLEINLSIVIVKWAKKHPLSEGPLKRQKSKKSEDSDEGMKSEDSDDDWCPLERGHVYKRSRVKGRQHFLFRSVLNYFLEALY